MFDAIRAIAPGVSILITTRLGGGSKGPYWAANLARHVGDDPVGVELNRQRLVSNYHLPDDPCWLEQVHGTNIVVVDGPLDGVPTADGAYTRAAGRVLAVMTADCLPVLLYSGDGTEIAAVHAGWRGLASGILQVALDRFKSRDIHAFVGPGIGPCHYEVDQVVRDAFVSSTPVEATGAFVASRPGHWQFDLVSEAARQLVKRGVVVTSSEVCTVCDERFYSYRRDGVTGRFASLIWRD